MTPNTKARRLSLTGTLADGTPVQEHVAVFSRGTRVYQATVIGTALGADGLETFFDALRLPN